MFSFVSSDQENTGNTSLMTDGGASTMTHESVSGLLSNELADGFDYPVGNKDGKGSYTSEANGKTYSGWYIAVKCAENYSLGIHTGEDWNGNGGGDTDLGQPVFATAKGKVVFATDAGYPWGNVVMIEHSYLENGKRKTVYSQYAHLARVDVKMGESIGRRAQIGTIGTGPEHAYPAHLHFEIRKSNMKDFPVDYWPSSNSKDVNWVKNHYESPSDFIRSHRTLTVPKNAGILLVAVKHEYKMYLIKGGEVSSTFEIALSQIPIGHKKAQGDLKLPEGEYFICQKVKGPIGGTNPYREYFGSAWMRINYPNSFDALSAFDSGEITQQQKTKITSLFKQKKETPKTTHLGGGIGIHGWVESDWDNDGPRDLTWGCISMHNSDLSELYKWIDIPTKIIILP